MVQSNFAWMKKCNFTNYEGLVIIWGYVCFGKFRKMGVIITWNQSQNFQNSVNPPPTHAKVCEILIYIASQNYNYYQNE